jgi:enolase
MSFEATPRPSPAEYFRTTELVQRVESTLNDCYAAQPKNPLRYVADRLRDGCESGLIDEVDCDVCMDGCGGTGFAIRVSLSNAASESVMIRCSVQPPHPSTTRTTVPLPKISGTDGGSKTTTATAVVRAVSCLKGIAVSSQRDIDRRVAEADATENFATLGSSLAAGLSLAACVAGAKIARHDTFMRIAALSEVQQSGAFTMPLPVVSLFGCGEGRAFGRLRVVEVCFVPAVNTDTATALRQAARLHELLSPRVDEAGVLNVDGSLRHVSPDSLLAAVDLVEDAMREDSLTPGTDAFIGVVCDSAWCFKHESKKYNFSDALGEVSGAQLAELIAGVCRDRPSVTYLEDTHHPSDKGEARRLMSRVGGTVSVCAINTCGANDGAAARCLEDKEANTIGVRIEDAGTVTQCINVLRTRGSRPGCASSVVSSVMSAPAIADLAVGAGARFLRAGGLGRGSGSAVYNRLAEIDGQLKRMGMRGTPSSGLHADCVLPDPPAEPVVEVQANDKKKKK